MRIFLLLWLCSIVWQNNAHSQTPAQRDSLLRVLNTMPDDTNRALLLNRVGFQLQYSKPDTTYLLGQQAYELSRKLNFPKGEYNALTVMAIASLQLGDYARAIKMYNQCKGGYIGLNDTYGVAVIMNNIGAVYSEQSKWQKALETYQEAYLLYKTIINPKPRLQPVLLLNIGESYYKLKQLDSAFLYYNRALPLAQKHRPDLLGSLYYDLGDVAVSRNKTAESLTYYRQSIAASVEDDSFEPMYEAYYRMAKLFQKIGQRDSTIYYAKQALTYGQKSSFSKGVLEASQLLTELYQGKNDTEALRYYRIAVSAKDSLYSQEKIKQLLSISFEEKQKEQQIEAANAEYKNAIKLYILVGVLVLLGAIALLLLRNNRQKQRANNLLYKQKEEINLQRNKAEKALSDLKTTQNQLIQKEKLASLGELTAGIAHEIQNPLNFVNNFSELSVELAQELKEEIEKSPLTPDGGITLSSKDKEYLEDIISDLSQNQAKINHHGKRASSIVSGMLEHSRTSTGERMMTDINKLADEYLRLSYHGMRAKDKNFNADYELIMDESLSKVNVVPQDIGRVLLNLINNAFYAAYQSKKPNPKVTITSDSIAHSDGIAVVIRVKDNGNGIPKENLEKIFQPFFTTKPTGEGTGLGLSLSYDIITKGHGGMIEVESVVGEGTTFIVKLPYQ